MKLAINNNQLELLQDKPLTLTERELFVKALINIDYIDAIRFHCLYNPQNLLFSTQTLSYDNDTTVYANSQEQTYQKFENISKIIVANIIIKSYDIVLENIYKCYIPSSFFAHEFDTLDLQQDMDRKTPTALFYANGIIYTTAILKLFEETIEKRNKRTEYKATIKKVLQIFCDEKSTSWQSTADEFVPEEFALPIKQHLYFLLNFYQR